MRIIQTSQIAQAVKKLALEANVFLSADIEKALSSFREKEESPVGRELLGVMQDNIHTAGKENMPICQDTGMCVVFLEIGQEVLLEGEFITDAVNEGIRQAYEEGYFRKSVVSDPLRRVNTRDNTPGIVYYQYAKGDKVSIQVMPKGFGSENCGAVYMLKPADGREGVMQSVLDAVMLAGSKPCPPMVVGVGIGGTMDKAALLAKEALLKDIQTPNPDPYYREMEEELLNKINNLGIGPQGLGGRTTALGVNILSYPTHIAGMPLAVNIGCHVSRHKEITL